MKITAIFFHLFYMLKNTSQKDEELFQKVLQLFKKALDVFFTCESECLFRLHNNLTSL